MTKQAEKLFSDIFNNSINGEEDGDTREQTEQAVKALLGSENIDVSNMKDEELDSLLQKLVAKQEESMEPTDTLEILYELRTPQEAIFESLMNLYGFHLKEAKVVYANSLYEKKRKLLKRKRSK